MNGHPRFVFTLMGMLLAGVTLPRVSPAQHAASVAPQQEKVGRQAAQKKPSPTVKVNPKDGAQMVLIPAGEYVAANIHLPEPRKRYLGNYYLYKDLVSVAQYRRFCQETGRAMPRQPDWTNAEPLEPFTPARWLKDEASRPVMGVTWDDAQAYCRWAGVSLPTDAQWEKAAWGNRGPDKPFESPHGVLDLRAIVQQWCEYNDEDKKNSARLKATPDPQEHSIRGAQGPFDPQPWAHSGLTRGIHGQGFRCAWNP